MIRYTTRIETWTTQRGTVTKVAVRDAEGKFHGATNFVQALDLTRKP